MKKEFWNDVQPKIDFRSMAVQLEELQGKYQMTRIENIVGLGSGSRSEKVGEEKGDTTRRTKFWLRQIAVILALAKLLDFQKQQETQPTRILSGTYRSCVKMYMKLHHEDPDEDAKVVSEKMETAKLNVTKKEFLNSVGITFLEEKEEAYASVTEQSLVYAAGAGPRILTELSNRVIWPTAIVSDEDVGWHWLVRSSQHTRGVSYTHMHTESQEMVVRGMVQGCDGDQFPAAAPRQHDGPEEIFINWRKSLPVSERQRSHRNSVERFMDFMSTTPSSNEGFHSQGDLSSNLADSFFCSVTMNPLNINSKNSKTGKFTQPASSLTHESNGGERCERSRPAKHE